MIRKQTINFLLRRITFQQPVKLRNYSNYQASPIVSKFKPTITEYDVSESKDEWKYVERILQPITVPEIICKESYQTDWKPASAKLGDYKYYINRNRNHMIPVYMQSTHRGMRKITEVRKIQGDIYEMEKDLKEIIESQTGYPAATQINEFVGIIKFKGDYVNIIKNFLMEKGF